MTKQTPRTDDAEKRAIYVARRLLNTRPTDKRQTSGVAGRSKDDKADAAADSRCPPDTKTERDVC
jgi:hypothetical protein